MGRAYLGNQILIIVNNNNNNLVKVHARIHAQWDTGPAHEEVLFTRG